MDIKEKFNKWRYKKVGSYIFDRIIFNLVILILVIGFLYIAYGYGLNKEGLLKDRIYIKCDDVKPCLNPFYISNSSVLNFNQDNRLSLEDKKRCKGEFCSWEYLPVGFEYGEKPNSNYNSFYGLTFGLLILAFVVNHLIYNMNYKLELKEE